MGLIAVKCSVCGGDVQLEDSLVSGVCEYCGATVLLEQAIPRTVRIDESGKIASYLKISRDALAVRNYDEALAYVNRAMEADAKSHEAYFLKGMALAQQKGAMQLDTAELCHYIRSAFELLKAQEEQAWLAYTVQYAGQTAVFAWQARAAYEALPQQTPEQILLRRRLLAGNLQIFQCAEAALTQEFLQKKPECQALKKDLLVAMVQLCQEILAPRPYQEFFMKKGKQKYVQRFLQPSGAEIQAFEPLRREALSALAAYDPKLAEELRFQPVLGQLAPARAELEKAQKGFRTRMIILGSVLGGVLLLILIGCLGQRDYGVIPGLVIVFAGAFGIPWLLQAKKIRDKKKQVQQLEEQLKRA